MACSLAGLRDPHMAQHGSFSFMSNFDLVLRHCRAHWGAATQHTVHQDGFKVVAIYALRRRLLPWGEAGGTGGAVGEGAAGKAPPELSPERVFVRARASFTEWAEACSPEDFSTMQARGDGGTRGVVADA